MKAHSSQHNTKLKYEFTIYQSVDNIHSYNYICNSYFYQRRNKSRRGLTYIWAVNLSNQNLNHRTFRSLKGLKMELIQSYSVNWIMSNGKYSKTLC